MTHLLFWIFGVAIAALLLLFGAFGVVSAFHRSQSASPFLFLHHP